MQNPMAKIRQLPNERKPREYLEDSELKKLFYSFDISYFSEHRDNTIISLILDTGMRLGECLMLSIKYLDISGCTTFSRSSLSLKIPGV